MPSVHVDGSSEEKEVKMCRPVAPQPPQLGVYKRGCELENKRPQQAVASSPGLYPVRIEFLC